ncbi:MFS transporter [Haloferax sp. DFSO52]|uniref:MFS transporter n=1 Tax=Haloferax sp. DFSO52 TaxID=3388505 RepID=UPI003A893C5F
MDNSLPPRLRSVPTETKLVIGLVSGAELVNHMYLVLFPPILGVLASDFEVSLFLLGLAMGAQGVTNTVFQLPFGYLSDNYSRTLTLGLSLGFGTLGVFIVAVAPSYPVLVAGQLLLGLGVAGHHPTHFPLLSEATPPELRGRAFSMRGFAGNIGFAIPPAFITAAIGLGGLSWRHAVGLIGIAGAVYTIVTLFVFVRYVGPGVTRPDRDDTTDTHTTRPLSQRILAELRSLAAAPAILALTFLAFIAAMSGWGVTTYTVILLTDGYGVGLDTANLTLTAMFLAGAVMVLVGGDLADRLEPGPVIVATFAVVGLLVTLFGSLAIPPVFAIVVALLIGGIRSLAGPARSKLTDSFSGRQALGMNFATITVGTMVGGALAPALFGALIDYVAIQVAFFAIAGFTFLALFVTVAIVYSYDESTSSEGVSTD